jgi:hypothetical protein
VEVDGVGHAPTFMPADQIAFVRDFLLAGLTCPPDSGARA